MVGRMSRGCEEEEGVRYLSRVGWGGGGGGGGNEQNMKRG